MAEAHKFTGSFGEAMEVFPDLPWKGDASGGTWVYDEKSDEYVPVSKGQFIYKVGTRYEVRDSEELTKTTKPATPADEKPVEKALAAKEESEVSEKDSE